MFIAEQELLKLKKFYTERRKNKASGGLTTPPSGSSPSSTSGGGEASSPSHSEEAAASLRLLLHTLKPSSIGCPNCRTRLRPGETCPKCFPLFGEKKGKKKVKKTKSSQDLKANKKSSADLLESPCRSFPVEEDRRRASCDICKKEMEKDVCEACYPSALGGKRNKATKKRRAKKN